MQKNTGGMVGISGLIVAVQSHYRSPNLVLRGQGVTEDCHAHAQRLM